VVFGDEPHRDVGVLEVNVVAQRFARPVVGEEELREGFDEDTPIATGDAVGRDGTRVDVVGGELIFDSGNDAGDIEQLRGPSGEQVLKLYAVSRDVVAEQDLVDE
jgi:hypothetical protein